MLPNIKINHNSRTRILSTYNSCFPPNPAHTQTKPTWYNKHNTCSRTPTLHSPNSMIASRKRVFVRPDVAFVIIVIIECRESSRGVWESHNNSIFAFICGLLAAKLNFICSPPPAVSRPVFPHAELVQEVGRGNARKLHRQLMGLLRGAWRGKKCWWTRGQEEINNIQVHGRLVCIVLGWCVIRCVLDRVEHGINLSDLALVNVLGLTPFGEFYVNTRRADLRPIWI